MGEETQTRPAYGRVACRPAGHGSATAPVACMHTWWVVTDVTKRLRPKMKSSLTQNFVLSAQVRIVPLSTPPSATGAAPHPTPNSTNGRVTADRTGRGIRHVPHPGITPRKVGIRSPSLRSSRVGRCVHGALERCAVTRRKADAHRGVRSRAQRPWLLHARAAPREDVGSDADQRLP